MPRLTTYGALASQGVASFDHLMGPNHSLILIATNPYRVNFKHEGATWDALNKFRIECGFSEFAGPEDGSQEASAHVSKFYDDLITEFGKLKLPCDDSATMSDVVKQQEMAVKVAHELVRKHAGELDAGICADVRTIAGNVETREIIYSEFSAPSLDVGAAEVLVKPLSLAAPAPRASLDLASDSSRAMGPEKAVDRRSTEDLLGDLAAEAAELSSLAAGIPDDFFSDSDAGGDDDELYSGYVDHEGPDRDDDLHAEVESSAVGSLTY